MARISSACPASSTTSTPTPAGIQRPLPQRGRCPDELLLTAAPIRSGQGGLESALTVAHELARERQDDAASQWELGALHLHLGDVLKVQGELGAARTAFGVARDIRSGLIRDQPDATPWQDTFSLRTAVWSVPNAACGHEVERLPLDACLVIAERVVNAEPSNPTWHGELADTQARLGDLLQGQGSLWKAETAFKAALASNRRVVELDPDGLPGHWRTAIALGRVANVLQVQGSLRAAAAIWREAIGIHRRLADQDPANGEWPKNSSRAATVQRCHRGCAHHATPIRRRRGRRESWGPRMAAPAHERLFLDNLPLIDRLIAAIRRRHRLTKEECEDFQSVVMIKLIDGDYEVLRGSGAARAASAAT